MNKRLISGVVIVSLLAGCTVGPKYRKPVVQPPSTFRGAGDAAATPDPDSLADLKWFEVFKDQQLQELVRTALVNNYDLGQAMERVQMARANLGITRSEQFPNVTASAEATTLRNPNSGQFALPSAANRDRTFGTVLLNLLSFEIDIWGRQRRATEAARADLLGAEETRKAVMTTVVGDVSAAYFNLLELDTELEIAQDTLATRKESLTLIRARQQGGIATLLDVRQAEQLVYAAAQTVPDIERLIEQTENRINLLLGKDPGPVARGRSLTEQEQPPDAPAGLPSSLLERRPDIRAAEATLMAATANIGVAKAAYFPQISLTGFLGGQSSQLANLFSGPGGAWNFAPQVTLPIFNAGRVKSGVRFTEAQRELALTQYQQSIKTAFREVSDALVEYRKVKEIRAQQESLVTTLQDRSRLAYLRYQGGVDTQLNALDADRDLFAAELSLAQTRRNELLALVQLYKALGGGWRQ
ncbi:MAG TPA: efflux transporter outer membrane subunit [Blastocatellia bacterium]|nr:efflux transporter outer membrane subunit [Blastocatellia bacterium]